MLKLTHITFENAPRIPSLRASSMTSIELDKPHEALKHWRIAVRGPSVFLISPPGYKTGRPSHQWDPQGAVEVHEIPRTTCFLHWSGDEADLKKDLTIAKYDSEPMGGQVPKRTPKVDPLASVPKHEIGDA